VVIHCSYLWPDEADRVVDAVRRGIGARTVPLIGSVEIVAADDGDHIDMSFFVPALGEHRTLRLEKDEQSSAEIEWRVREKLSDL
jgi:hypothetical protein